MNRDYKISNDGTIFEIKDDGSIAKLAKINNRGQISTLSGTIMTADGGNKGRYRFFLTLFVLATVVFGILYFVANTNYSNALRAQNYYRYNYESMSSKYEDVSSVTKSLQSEIGGLRQECDNAKAELSNFQNKVSNIYPLIITDIEIANVTYEGAVQTDYGNSLYGSSTMYLKPRIKYTGLTSGNKTLKIKWYNPDGTISRGDSSPSGFSQSESLYVCSGDDNIFVFAGWGNSRKGYWRSGTYRIEIWYENICLKSKSFTIY